MEKLLKWWHSINPFDITQSYFEEPRIFFSDTFNKNRLSEFHNGDNKEKLFTQTERSRLVAYILESTPFSAEDDKQSDGGSEDRYVLGKTSLIDLGVLMLHILVMMAHYWKIYQNKNQPMFDKNFKKNGQILANY